MPRPLARNKTKKSAAKRFKISATGKILRSRAGRRHLAASKSNSNKRRLARRTTVDPTAEVHVKNSLPFGLK
jgi:large subunit ribosomal protein L35